MGSYLVGVMPINGTYLHEDFIYSRTSCCLLLGFAFLCASLLLLMKSVAFHREQLGFIASQLGCWHRVDVPNFTISRDVAEWSPRNVPYSEGAIVQRRGRLFVGLGRSNTAKPGSVSACLIFLLHNQPLVVSNWVVGTQLCVSASQLLLLLAWSRWWEGYAVMTLVGYHSLLFFLSCRHLCSSYQGSAQTQQHKSTSSSNSSSGSKGAGRQPPQPAAPLKTVTNQTRPPGRHSGKGGAASTKASSASRVMMAAKAILSSAVS